MGVVRLLITLICSCSSIYHVRGPRRTKTSLLGPPPSMPMPSMLSNAIRIPPSSLPPPSMPPPIISPGGRLQWPPNMPPPIMPPPHIMGGPPPSRTYPQKDESWKTPRPSEDIDLRQMTRPPSQTGDVDMRQTGQWNNGGPSPSFNDPRLRSGVNEMTEDVRDPRRRNQGNQSSSQGNQMMNPWGNDQPPMQFNVPPPMGGQSQMGGPPGGMRGGMRGGRGGQMPPFRGNRGGPPRGRGSRGRGGPY